MDQDQDPAQDQATPVAAQPLTEAPAPDREDEVAPDHEFKQMIRANARWVMAELQLAQAGMTADERAKANP